MSSRAAYALAFAEFGRGDIARVGGKNASLGEMIRHLGPKGVAVPAGFATTAAAYWEFLASNRLEPVIDAAYAALGAGTSSLAETGHAIRTAIQGGQWPAAMAADILAAYHRLQADPGVRPVTVAVRSSATAEDLPEASFAGQLESFLNITGDAAVLDACKRCYASLFTDRAISYRQLHGFDHRKVALSVGVQRMVRADTGGAGVMFSLDTDSGFDKVVLISAAWGLGENVVQGTVEPDEYQVFKPLLDEGTLAPIVHRKLGDKAMKSVYALAGDATRSVPTTPTERESFVLDDKEVLQLARWAVTIERHYGMPMDMEWARDGETREIFIVQARPETVQSRRSTGLLRTYHLDTRLKPLLEGIAIGDAVVSGPVCRIRHPADRDRFVEGSILVAETTDPDWLPVMRRARALITDHGGRTSHAAIVSRELGLPAIVGTGQATALLEDGQVVSVSCAEGAVGHVYAGALDFRVEELPLKEIPATRTRVMLNLADPAAAYRWWQLPADGVGLARMEFVISNHVRVHPLALLRYDTLTDATVRQQIDALTRGYADRSDYFVDQLSLGLARIAAALFPKPVIIRMSDFKTNEYANLLGGAQFEQAEENPMLGLRGASRYYSEHYRDGFVLECRAIRRLRDVLGFRNVLVMIPFCRSPLEADRVLAIMAEQGLKRGGNGLEVYVMCEIPSNVILAREFAARFDGFSIGSNDLTQLTLGVDRDSEALAALFDEQDAAVRWMIQSVIRTAHECGVKVGLCGQAPSNHPEFARFLVDCGIDSISVTPDSFVAVKRQVALAEAAAGKLAPRQQQSG
jgi:pyruvate, water dikinase